MARRLLHQAVQRVYYPGLPTDAGHDLAKRQMRDFGGMISIRLQSPNRVKQSEIWRRLCAVLSGIAPGQWHAGEPTRD